MSNLDGSDEQASPSKRLCIRPNDDTTSPDIIQKGINWQDWNNDQLISKLRSNRLDENIVFIFEKNKCTGRDLKGLTVDALMTMGEKSDLDCMGIDCMGILKFLESIGAVDKLEKKNSKVFNDPIHGHFEVHPACIAIIDTPQFQRLRYLKQLGMCYFVYPGAAHNRFEHSLGVYYLAGQFVKILRQNQPYLGITDKDILCVEIAGLCHDLGHGPFSHLFDGKFMPAVNPERKFKHEKASLDMLDYLIADNQLMEPGGALHQYGIDQTDIIFIKEQIYGPLDGHGILKGRPKHKHYLYEIVSNKRNEIDVDKWDYFARDCHHLGIQQNFDHFRFMKFARVIEHEGSWQICTRDKEIGNLYNMFYTRYTLHRTAYQHRVCTAIETMVANALIKANDHLRFFRKDGTTCKMSECIDDMRAYSELTDEVIFKILYSESQENDMKEAKSIIQRIFKRDLYVCVCQSKPVDSQSFQLTTNKIREEIFEKLRAAGQVTEADLVVQIAYLDFGMKHQNPVERLLVYSKSEPDKARYLPKIEASRVLGPLKFSELLIRVLSCKKENSSAIKKAAKQWFEENPMQLAPDGWEDQILLTPHKEPTEAVGNKTPVTAGKQRALFSSFETTQI